MFRYSKQALPKNRTQLEKIKGCLLVFTEVVISFTEKLVNRLDSP